MYDRRSFLRVITSLAAALLSTMKGVRAFANPAVPSKLELAITEAIGERTLKESSDGRIKLETPELAENGAIVPITIESNLPDVREILLFVEKNPTPLAARFHYGREMVAFASLRIKMNESCDVLAVVRSGSDFYSTRKKVTVMVGGCG